MTMQPQAIATEVTTPTIGNLSPTLVAGKRRRNWIGFFNKSGTTVYIGFHAGVSSSSARYSLAGTGNGNALNFDRPQGASLPVYVISESGSPQITITEYYDRPANP